MALEASFHGFLSCNASSTHVYVDYETFSSVREQLKDREALGSLLTPTVFLKLPRDGQSRVELSVLMQFINKKVEMDRIHIQLQFYDMVISIFLPTFYNSFSGGSRIPERM